MDALYTNLWAWATWFIIGLIGGLMAYNFLPGKRRAVYDIAIGLVSAVAGGWLSAYIIRAQTPQAFAISALTSVFVCGAVIYLTNKIRQK